MRQIVDAIKYLHSRKIIHRYLNLDNIMVSFDSENDKNMLNMMHARIKIINFRFAIHLANSNLAFSALGSPQNMDPIILKNFTNRGEDFNKLGYDCKADIWSIGTICYELLIGKAPFNGETMNDLVKNVESGSYSIPISLSKEVVSFLNCMLQYNPNYRFSADDLSKHPFLTKRINEFSKIDIRKVSNKMNVKRNQTIWAIFNEEEEDEKKLLNLKGGKDLPAPQGPVPLNSQPTNNLNNINNNNFGARIYRSHTYQYPNFSSLNQSNSFYGQNIYPSMRKPGMNQMYQQNQIMSNMQVPMGGLRPIPRQQMPGMKPMSAMPVMGNDPMKDFPTFNISSTPPSYSDNLGACSANNLRFPQSQPSVYNGNSPYANKDDDNIGAGEESCNIQ